MSSATTYQDIHALKKLFAEAGETGIMASNALADILNATAPNAKAWPESTRKEWQEGCEHIFEGVKATDKLAPEQVRLLQAMLYTGIDTPMLREKYNQLFKALFPRCTNTAGILDAIGIDTVSDLAVAAGRLKVFAAIKEDATCWDAAFGLGKVLGLDEAACEVKVSQERERLVPLQDFLDRSVIILKGSAMEALIEKKSVNYADSQELHNAAREGLVTRLEITSQLVDKILVPAIYTADELRRIAAPAREARATTAEKDAAPALASRWDYSRSLVEIEGRIEKAATLEADDINRENIQNILMREAPRKEMAVRWANVVSIICKNQNLAKPLTEFLKGIKDSVAAWNNTSLFVEVTDQLPGKQVSLWLQLTKAVAGEKYLIDGTLMMPFRLWSHAEQALADKEEHQRFVDRVYQDFKDGKPTADHYCWLWKAPKSEQRAKFLSDSYLLFKTLHKDLKGSYLKAQRNIRKLLLDDMAFQKAIMKDGDPEAIRNLVRCVKRVPLLNSSEKQSVLVKLVRIYPSARPIVEDNGSAPAPEKQSIDRITSIRSYERVKRELERLVNELIPANTSAIEDARSRGDLSENSEYKYAKEQQRMLNRRRSELESSVSTCKPIDFAEQEVNEYIIPGTVVTLSYGDGSSERITLLGLFDTDSEKGWFSYDSPMGRILLGKKAGERIRVPAGKDADIEKLEPIADELIEFLRTAE